MAANWQRQRPTHFLALQVSHSPAVLAAIRHVHDALRQHDPALEAVLENEIKAHITLAMLHPGEDAAQAGAAWLQSLVPQLKAAGLLQPVRPTLCDLGTFGDKVLYLGVARGPELERLHALAAALKSALPQGWLLQDGNGFTPHVTIAKVQYQQPQDNGSPTVWRIPPEAYAHLAGINCGEVVTSEVQLCVMGGHLPGSYYRVEHAMQLSEAPMLAVGHAPALVTAAAAAPVQAAW